MLLKINRWTKEHVQKTKALFPNIQRWYIPAYSVMSSQKDAWHMGKSDPLRERALRTFLQVLLGLLCHERTATNKCFSARIWHMRTHIEHTWEHTHTNKHKKEQEHGCDFVVFAQVATIFGSLVGNGTVATPLSIELQEVLQGKNTGGLIKSSHDWKGRAIIIFRTRITHGI